MRETRPIRSELDLYQHARKERILTIAWAPKPEPARIDDPDDWLMLRLHDDCWLQWELELHWTPEPNPLLDAFQLNVPFFSATHFVVTTRSPLELLIPLADLIVRTDTISGRDYYLDKPGMTVYCVPFHRHGRLAPHALEWLEPPDTPLFARLQPSQLAEQLPTPATTSSRQRPSSCT